MGGLLPVLRKELADHFSSRRFAILFALICVAGLSATYAAAQSMRSEATGSLVSGFAFLQLFTTSNGTLPPFVAFIGFLGPLVGLALGFDAINSEQTRGTLSRLLSQPIYRDSVINGKFLAGVATIGIMLLGIQVLLGGLGLRVFGVPPTLEEVLRLGTFLGLSIVYVAFWMSLSILFSIFFRQAATSALAGIAVWIFVSFFVTMLAGLAADAVAPVPVGQEPTEEVLVENAQWRGMLSRISPATLYQEATITVLSPNIRTVGPITLAKIEGMLPRPLAWTQSLVVVWPQVIGLVALTVVCFAISYVRFMRQEIRAI